MKQVSAHPSHSGRRFLLIGAVFCALLALTVRWPGSVPRGWQYSSGVISSAVGKVTHGTTQYYPTVQYLALGYSYDMASSRGLPIDPAPGSGSYTVAFNPEHPEQAKIIGETPPNYFAVLFPLLALILVAIYSRTYLKAIFQSLVRRVQVHIAAKVEAELAAREAAEAAAALALEAAAPTEAEPALSTSEAEAEVSEPMTAPPLEVIEELEQANTVEEVVTPVDQAADNEAAGDISAPLELPDSAAVVPEETVNEVEQTTDIETSDKPKPKVKKTIKPKPSPSKSIYIPKVESSAEQLPDTPRSAAELKTKLKTPKSKSPVSPKKKPQSKKSAVKKRAPKKTATKSVAKAK